MRTYRTYVDATISANLACLWTDKDIADYKLNATFRYILLEAFLVIKAILRYYTGCILRVLFVFSIVLSRDSERSRKDTSLRSRTASHSAPLF